ncbi:IS1 encoded protein [Enterobacter sp. RIT418]|nr:IS1 encoded protein [Enterobacter sp. RIT 418]
MLQSGKFCSNLWRRLEIRTIAGHSFFLSLSTLSIMRSERLFVRA